MSPKAAKFKYILMMLFQLLLMGLFFGLATYGPYEATRGFADTHVMIFVGFGFLMTFMKKYSYSGVGFNLLLAALVIQLALLAQSAFHMKNGSIYITNKSLLQADIMSATVLITFGVVLGVASDVQMIFIAIVETIIGCINLWLLEDVFQASDAGGSIAIHTYGAYFGFGVSLALRCHQQDNVPSTTPEVILNAPTYTSDLFAMIGSLFLWIYWPSFNAGLTGSDMEYQRAVINTYLSLASATVTTFFLSVQMSKTGGKIEMVHIQNSTLAGGVAIGAVCNMHVSPGGAIAIGICAAVISVLGYNYLTPALAKIGIVDTCGVHNLHGMPGVFSGLVSVIIASLATKETYGAELGNVFGAMGTGRTAGNQALYQFIALVTTIAIGLFGGFFTGTIVRIKACVVKNNERYDDEIYWDLPA